MAVYDHTKDNVFFVAGTIAAKDSTRVTVSLVEYNGGETKVSILREYLDRIEGEWKPGKLGRMTLDEAKAVVPLVQKCLDEVGV